MKTKVCISKNMAKFGPTAKTFNDKCLVMKSSVGTNSTIVNKPSGFIPPEPATWIKSQNNITSTYTNKNNNELYQGLTKKNNNNPSYKDSKTKPKKPRIRRKFLSKTFLCHQLKWRQVKICQRLGMMALVFISAFSNWKALFITIIRIRTMTLKKERKCLIRHHRSTHYPSIG